MEPLCQSLSAWKISFASLILKAPTTTTMMTDRQCSSGRRTMRGKRLLRTTTTLLVLCGGIFQQPPRAESFSVLPSSMRTRDHFLTTTTITTRLYAAPEDVSKMKAGAIRKELESYGIGTRTFLEKKELVEALIEARASGKTPKTKEEPVVEKEEEPTAAKTTKETKEANGQTKANGDADPKQKTTSTESTKSRQERFQEEMKVAQGMKVGELREKLKTRGIATRSFFEKSEFEKAYADAVVDGVGAQKVEEPMDPSYKDVTMMRMEKGKQPMARGPVIDVKLSQ